MGVRVGETLRSQFIVAVQSGSIKEADQQTAIFAQLQHLQATNKGREYAGGTYRSHDPAFREVIYLQVLRPRVEIICEGGSGLCYRGCHMHIIIDVIVIHAQPIKKKRLVSSQVNCTDDKK
jgi:hypothetical protein